MKTTDVFVEQVLIGFLVLLVPGLMFADRLVPLMPSLSEGVLGELVTAGAFIGIAYLVGMLYDRYADTLLENLDRYHRLDHAVGVLTRGVPHELPDELKTDPFPEGRLRKAVRQKPHDAAYHDYLRSRIRLTRALTTLIPALALSGVLLLVKVCPLPPWWLAGAWGIPVVYAITFVAKLAPPSDDPKQGWAKWVVAAKPPRTDATGRTLAYLQSRLAPSAAKEKVRRLRWPADVVVLGGVTLLTILGLVVALSDGGDWRYALIPLAAVPLTLLAGWTWWRITTTFYSLLEDYRRDIEGDTPPTP